MRIQDCTFEEFMQIKSKSADRVEYVDGKVMMAQCTSIAYQRISGNLFFELRKYFKDKSCKVFSAPTDIELTKDDNKNLVIPDLSVMCDKTGFTNNRYVGVGVPTLIVEILSPSNQSYDLITKMEIYMRYGVKEYWIVNPIKKSLTIYSLDENNQYEQYCVLNELGEAESKVFKTLKIDMKDIFLNQHLPQ